MKFGFNVGSHVIFPIRQPKIRGRWGRISVLFCPLCILCFFTYVEFACYWLYDSNYLLFSFVDLCLFCTSSIITFSPCNTEYSLFSPFNMWYIAYFCLWSSTFFFSRFLYAKFYTDHCYAGKSYRMLFGQRFGQNFITWCYLNRLKF